MSRKVSYLRNLLSIAVDVIVFIAVDVIVFIAVDVIVFIVGVACSRLGRSGPRTAGRC
jgi:hypothetical protein